MRYEEPRMEVLELEAEDIITLSNDETGSTDTNNSGKVEVGNNGWIQ